MMNSLSLIDQLNEPTKAHHNHPQTSKKAAKSLQPGKLRHKILKTLEANPNGLAAFEVAEILETLREYVGPNFVPMQRMGLVEKTGFTRINHKTKMKADNQVWRLASGYFKHNISKIDLPHNCLSPDQIRKLIKKSSFAINKEISEIVKLGITHLENFNPVTMIISRNFECQVSKIGMCVYNLVAGRPIGSCIFCKDHQLPTR